MKVVAAILAAGRGERFGGDKTSLILGDRPVWRWSYDTFSNLPAVDEVFLVTAPDRMASLLASLPPGGLVSGGLTRRESSLAALDHAEEIGADVLLLQDAARPFVSSTLITSVIEAIAEAGAAAPGVPVTDTIKEVLPSGVRTLPRENLVAMQTPQGARVDLLRRAHREGPADATDDMVLIESLGVHPRIVPGDPSNFKITIPGDFARAATMLGSETRTGIGYDVHAFVEDSSDEEKVLVIPNARADGSGPLPRPVRDLSPSTDSHPWANADQSTPAAQSSDRPQPVDRLSPESSRQLWLGGVLFPGHQGLTGHSDADVLLHAITDALLGAASLGDIGVHFPPTDPQWKDRSSSHFLRHAAELLRESGWGVVNIDATCIAETPKIMPQAPAIRSAIALAVGIDPDRVSVKATTNERLGSIGRGEGIAAFAVATISRAGR